MTALRIEYRRANIAAFWALGAVALFVIVGAAGVGIGAAAPWRVAAVVVLLALLPGVVWQSWFERGVWLWNGSMRYLAGALAAYILRVSYFLLLAPLGASDSRLDLRSARSRRSRWLETPWQTDERVSLSSRSETHHGLHAFVRTPGNAWASVLFPLVFFLAALRDRKQEATPPGTTYTLY
jgi:hypothetical protein